MTFLTVLTVLNLSVLLTYMFYNYESSHDFSIRKLFNSLCHQVFRGWLRVESLGFATFVIETTIYWFSLLEFVCTFTAFFSVKMARRRIEMFES